MSVKHFRKYLQFKISPVGKINSPSDENNFKEKVLSLPWNEVSLSV
jgi:hypothetical protein